MDQELQTEMLTGSWRTLLHMLRADAACALTRWRHILREKTSRPPTWFSIWRWWRHTFKTATMTSARCCIRRIVRRLPASLPSACDVIGSLYAVQFLNNNIFVLVS